jgi:hypothetical protein
MHETDLPLGKYAKDPRFKIVRVDGHDAIRTDRVTILKTDRGFEVWPLDEHNALAPADRFRHLSQALAYDLGDAQRVGPTGMRDWLHTDGRTYRHDPTTTGMIQADSLRAGDIVDFPDVEAFEILEDAAPVQDAIGRWVMTYPTLTINSKKIGTLSPRSGDMIPIRFAR